MKRIKIEHPDGMPYGVNMWGSRPGTNDDCHTGVDFSSRADAEAFYAAPFEGPHATTFWCNSLRSPGTWLEIDGPDIHEERCVTPGKRRDDDDDWRRERAMEAGMAFGCDGYNDAMGWGLDHE